MIFLEIRILCHLSLTIKNKKNYYFYFLIKIIICCLTVLNFLINLYIYFYLSIISFIVKFSFPSFPYCLNTFNFYLLKLNSFIYFNYNSKNYFISYRIKIILLKLILSVNPHLPKK